ncbi:MAG TPA: LacI family DNA-binding transcriptional regulator [Fimbriimonas sp.]|nr:LacI family DNA-binding transcriptional regulator [Fimbriimonas sp.]
MPPIKPRRPTRADVAREAGVAPSTVSLILRDRGDDLRIPVVTQERVREAARLLGYYPNRHIQSVLKGRSGILGLYLRWDQWSTPVGYWPTVFWCIQKAAAELDIQLLVHNARADTPTEENFARQAGGIVDGVMIVNSGDDPIVKRILEVGLPAVEVGDPYSLLPFVGLESKQGIRLAMEHLKERGYRRPALFMPPSNYQANAQARVEEFLCCCDELFELEHPASRVLSRRGFFEHLLALDPKPDSVICNSDSLAYLALKRCNERGLRVPEDLAIIGYDALETEGCLRTLTSVQTPLEEMARLALRKLLQIVNGEPFEHQTILPVGLRVGDTT